MSENGNLQPRRRKTRKKVNLESVMAEAESLLASKKKKRKPYVSFFSKNPVTGVRSTHCKYRPRKRRSTSNTSTVSESSNSLEVEVSDNPAEDDYDLHTESFSEDLDKLLDECSSYIKTPTVRKNWNTRMEDLDKSWASKRPEILQALLEMECLSPSRFCVLCKQGQACVRCHHCGLKEVICLNCDEEVHSRNPFHDRDIYHEGFFKPVAPSVSLDSDGNLMPVLRCLPHSVFLHGHVCDMCKAVGSFEPVSTGDIKGCIVVTVDGRFDLNVCNYGCNSCGHTVDPLQLKNLVFKGYWPGTVVNTQYVFTQDVLKKWDSLQKRLPGSSESGFLRSLEDFSVSRGRVGVINDTAFSSAFKEWKFCNHEINQLQFKDFMVCPTCATYQHSVHVDGNAKLYRYKSAGKKKRDSYYGETFIANNSKVDSHLRTLYQNSNQSENTNSTCGESHWQAARNTLKKKKHLDETGLTITGCRHGIAQRAVNMFYGEVYGYAHYLQINDMIPRKVSFFWEDVVCRYWPWLKKKDPVSASKMSPALSVMHGKAHSWSCQVLWGGWWQDGAARSTGEEVEQINSYVSRCGSTSKHMCPEGREELLTEHVMAWNYRKILNLAEALSKRFLKVNKDLQKHCQDFNALARELGVEVVSHNLDIWTSQVREHAKQLDNKSGANANDQKSFELQQKIEYMSYSINQRLQNIGRLADTSKQRHRLRKKISDEKADLAKLISEYNDLTSTVCKVEIADAMDNNFPWALPDQCGETPVRTKKQVVEKYLEGNRLREEKVLLEKEMTGFLKFYKDTVIPGISTRIDTLTAVLNESSGEAPLDEASTSDTLSLKDSSSGRYCCQSKDPLVVLGKMALARKGLAFAKSQIAQGVRMFKAATKGDYREFLDTKEQHSENSEEDSDLSEVEWEDIAADMSDSIFEEPSLKVDPVSSVDGDVTSWMFPAEFCQSSIDGRNGSNACSVISLAVAHTFLTTDIPLPLGNHLPLHWTKLLYLCMHLGNALYDNARQSLPHRYLNAAEGAQLFSSYSPVKVGQPYPVRVQDQHPLSTIEQQLRTLVEQKKRCAALFIYDDKTVAFLVSQNGTIIAIDSHSHPPYGAVIIAANSLSGLFVSSFQKMAGLNDSTFGNLTIVEI